MTNSKSIAARHPDLSPINSRRASALTGRMMLVVFGALGALITWSATASLEEKAIAPGRIIPAGEIRSVQHLEGGIVDEILVSDGSRVAAGDALVRLKRKSATAERDRMLARSEVFKTRAVRIRAELEGKKPVFENPGSTITKNELAVFESRRASLNSERNVLKGRLVASDARIVSLNAEIESYKKRRSLVAKEVEMRERLSKSGTGSRLELIKIQETYESINTDIARLNGDIAQSREDISETRTRIAELENRYRERATVELAETTSQLSELHEVAKGLEDRVVRLEVTAPVDGVIQNLSVTSVGDVLAAGSMIAQIVPVDEELIADIEISPRDIGFVQSGQEVAVKVNAFDFARFGAVEGMLNSVSPTTYARDDGSVYYRGRVILKQAHLGPEKKILPGMTLQADIRTGSKTLFEYMLKPIYTSLDGGFRER